MDDDELTPSGSDVVSTRTSDPGFFGQIGDLLVNGASRAIDLEFAQREQIIDSATQARFQPDQFGQPGFADVVENLTPIQIGGLLVALALSVALVAGAFR